MRRARTFRELGEVDERDIGEGGAQQASEGRQELASVRQQQLIGACDTITPLRESSLADAAELHSTPRRMVPPPPRNHLRSVRVRWGCSAPNQVNRMPTLGSLCA